MAVEHTDMLDAPRQRQFSRGAIRKMTVSLAGDRGSTGGEIYDAQAFIAEHGGFECTDDNEQIAWTGRGHDRRKHRYCDGCLDSRARLRKPHDNVGSHRMPQYRKPAVAPR